LRIGPINPPIQCIYANKNEGKKKKELLPKTGKKKERKKNQILLMLKKFSLAVCSVTVHTVNIISNTYLGNPRLTKILAYFL
jgi:hypothetical protein